MNRRIFILLIIFVIILALSAEVYAEERDISTWVPNKGDLNIGEDVTYGYRYISNWFYWNTSSDLSGFSDWNETLEMDVVFPASAPYIGDYSGFWDSNLPSAYLDTNLSDSSQDELPYAVGTCEAEELLPQKWYHYYLEGTKGKDVNGNIVTTSKVKHAPQRGYSVDFPCGAYTVFSEQTYFLWSWTANKYAPNYISWTR